jgi:hypothetical protein
VQINQRERQCIVQDSVDEDEDEDEWREENSGKAGAGEEEEIKSNKERKQAYIGAEGTCNPSQRARLGRRSRTPEPACLIRPRRLAATPAPAFAMASIPRRQGQHTAHNMHAHSRSC